MTESLLKRSKKKKGFTLIELIVVIAIIAIISLIAIPKVMGYQDDAKKKADIANAKTIANVAASQITKGDISVPDAGLDIIIDTVPASVTAPTSTVAGAKYFITSNLQAIPKMQYSTNNGLSYYVHLDKDGTVTIYDSDSSVASFSGTDHQVYPQPTSGSGKYK